MGSGASGQELREELYQRCWDDPTGSLPGLGGGSPGPPKINAGTEEPKRAHKHIHIYTRVHIYIYMYVFMFI